MPQRQIPSVVQAVLFDVDGTLVDSIAMIVSGLGDTAEKFSGIRPSDALIKSLVGRPLKEQLSIFENRDLSEDEYWQRHEFTMGRFQAHEHKERLFDPAVQLLKDLYEAGCKTALVTSKDAIELEHFSHRFPAMSHVSVAVCASDTARPKPFPDPALLALEKLGVAAENAVMIGDSIFDLRCAASAGIANIAVSYGAGGLDSLREEDPTLLFTTPNELYDWGRSEILHKTLCHGRNP